MYKIYELIKVFGVFLGRNRLLTSLMQQCWLKLDYHCLERGSVLEDMFALVNVNYLQNLWARLVILEVF